MIIKCTKCGSAVTSGINEWITIKTWCNMNSTVEEILIDYAKESISKICYLTDEIEHIENALMEIERREDL